MSSTKLIRKITDPLNTRLTSVEQTGLYYAKPIKGIVSNTTGLVNGDRVKFMKLFGME